jgi:hypothetical protein
MKIIGMKLSDLTGKHGWTKSEERDVFEWGFELIVLSYALGLVIAFAMMSFVGTYVI